MATPERLNLLQITRLYAANWKWIPGIPIKLKLTRTGTGTGTG
ncbi:MAG: hypothetical protein OEX07_11610 [Gammaproteobacteria bacterium]|nr:hypothetical protein [Gammaproteobacteria bacterium]